jgi:hypothetical protein
VEFLLKEVKEMDVNKVNDKDVRSFRFCHFAYDCYYLEMNTLFESFLCLLFFDFHNSMVNVHFISRHSVVVKK